MYGLTILIGINLQKGSKMKIDLTLDEVKLLYEALQNFEQETRDDAQSEMGIPHNELMSVVDECEELVEKLKIAQECKENKPDHSLYMKMVGVCNNSPMTREMTALLNTEISDKVKVKFKNWLNLTAEQIENKIFIAEQRAIRRY